MDNPETMRPNCNKLRGNVKLRTSVKFVALSPLSLRCAKLAYLHVFPHTSSLTCVAPSHPFVVRFPVPLWLTECHWSTILPGAPETIRTPSLPLQQTKTLSDSVPLWRGCILIGGGSQSLLPLAPKCFPLYPIVISTGWCHPPLRI